VEDVLARVTAGMEIGENQVRPIRQHIQTLIDDTREILALQDTLTTPAARAGLPPI
jgi:hypothetical protein